MDIQPTVTELVNNISHLEEKEFEKLFKKLSILQMQRSGASVLPAEESELLQKLNNVFSSEKWERLKYLDWKSEFDILNETEAKESLQLAEEYENLTVLRLKILTKLSDLRDISIEDLVKDLGIKPIENA